MSTTVWPAAKPSARSGSSSNGPLAVEPDRGRVDDQLEVGLVGLGDRPAPELSAEVRRAELGPVPDLDLGPLADQRPDHGAGGAAGAEDQGPTPLGRVGQGVEQARPRRCCRR